MGTTYTGIAFTFVKSSDHIETIGPGAGGKKDKTPTVLLLDRHLFPLVARQLPELDKCIELRRVPALTHVPQALSPGCRAVGAQTWKPCRTHLAR